MFNSLRSILAISLLTGIAFAQEIPPAAPAQSEPKLSAQNPPIKVNILNVCTPNESEKQELGAALKKIPAKVTFATPWEVTRGVTLADNVHTKYIRLRRELTGDPTFNIIQYSLSADPKETQETLIFKVKDPKDLLLIAIEDSISASAAAPGTVLDADTPARHIKIERFGKSGIVLARCEQADQGPYEGLFSEATKALSNYRKSLGLRKMFSSELKWLGAPDEKTAKAVANRIQKPAKTAKSNPIAPQKQP